MKEIVPIDPKKAFLEQFRKTFTDKYEKIGWTDTQKRQVAQETSRGNVKSLMFTSIPMICRGEKCPFSNQCPLFLDSIHPIEETCPYEYGMVVNFMNDYIDELNIDPENLTELSQVRDLVDQEIQYIRKSRILAQEDFIQEFVVGVDGNGDPVMSTRLHLAIEWEDKILKRKAVLWKQMLASREAQAKVGLAALDSAQSMSNLMSKVRDVQDKRDRELKQSLGIIDKDDYIDVEPEDEDE